MGARGAILPTIPSSVLSSLSPAATATSGAASTRMWLPAQSKSHSPPMTKHRPYRPRRRFLTLDQLMHSAQSRRIALLREIRLRRELLSHRPDYGIAREGQGLRPLVQKTLRAEDHDFKL
jgi:hypothetical protein